MKTRKQKTKLYEERYKDIPRDYMKRLEWMYDKYHLSINKATHILQTRNDLLQTIKFEKEFFIILYEEPEGSPRPRARLVEIFDKPSVYIYSINGPSDNTYMKQLIETHELKEFKDHLIYTPCYVDYKVYFRTPSYYNTEETYLAELGLMRPICKPDFDNIEKKYADMYNMNIWLDDALVVDAHIAKYYSILPRVEITLHYLNMLYNKHQAKSIQSKISEEAKYYGRI